MTHSLRCGLGSVAAAAAEDDGDEADDLGGPGNVNRAADCLKNRDWSIEYKPLVVVDFVVLQIPQELGLERLLRVVLLLVGDVELKVGQDRFADRESAVADLPGEVFSFGKCVVNPAGGVGFDVAHHVGQHQRRGQLGQQMYVVGNAADANRHTPQFSDDAPQIRVQPLLQFKVNERLAMFGAENNVEVEPRERMGHESLRNEELGFAHFRAIEIEQMPEVPIL